MFKRFRRGRPPRGQAVVEFTLVLPILLLLLLGIGDLARVYTTALTVEAGVREGADYGSFQSFYWDTSTSNPSITNAEIEHRVCQAASTLPDYQTTDPTNKTCTNPAITIELLNPSNLHPDCSLSPVPPGSLPCTVHVSAAYSFRPFFGGIGVGIVSLPSSVAITREAYFVVNDFPATP